MILVMEIYLMERKSRGGIMTIYKKIIRPMIYSSDGRNMTLIPFEDYWYDDNYTNREIVAERFNEKNDDPWASLKWDEKYVEIGRINE